MRRRWWLVLAASGLLGMCAGCVTAPEKIDVRVGSGPSERVDSRRVPETSSHEEARAELRRAYRYIAQLEDENRHLEQKADKYKRQREECEDRLERYED